mgnify:CR=1 FL=1
MAQITDGIRSILASPHLYDLFQRMVGVDAWRQDFVKRFVRPQGFERVLDIGCGTARILDDLPAGVVYFGFDASQSYIAAARERYGQRAHLTCALVSEMAIEEAGRFDLVLVSGVLHHLDDMQANQLLEVARFALREGGRLVAIDPCHALGQSRIAQYVIRRDRGQDVRTAPAYEALARAVFNDVQGQIVHRRWIPYTHWVMECRP